MAHIECTTQAEADAAAVRGDVIVWRAGYLVARGSARVSAYGSARVYARGSASVDARDSASVYAGDSACVFAHDSARVYARESARVVAHGSACVFARESARVMEGDTSRPLLQSRPVVLIGPIGSRSAMLSVYQCEDGGQLIRAGCFFGTRDEFAAAVAAKHPSGQYADEYRAALAMIDALKGAA